MASMSFQVAICLSGLLIILCGDNVSCREFPTLDHLVTDTPEQQQAKAVMDMIGRLLPNLTNSFYVSVDKKLGPVNKDTFQISTMSGQLQIQGTSGVAAAWGLHYYLKYYCGCHISWGGRQLNIPTPMPRVPYPGVKKTSNDRFRYYQNVCTVSYSFAWWDWARWEEEIDWMALSGINLPLAFNGQEAIWQKVYMKLGLTRAEVDEHFGGPAFFAWARMGNIRGWGGPLSDNWHQQQLALQHKILERMAVFGMTPVLPAFAGHVPKGLTRLFPNSSITRLSDWGGFKDQYCCTYLLDPNDKLFQQIGGDFIKEYIKEFNYTSHIYNTDTFNEMTPKSSDPAYLSSTSKAVYDAMIAGDSQAIWLMQGWLFLSGFWKPPQAKALLTGVPQGHMIVLDLMAELSPQYQRLESYYGQPFIWCMLHNFGGNNQMFGNLESINKNPFVGRNFTDSTMIGTGLTPEGINQNNMVYEFMNENIWRTEPRNIMDWVAAFVKRRYTGTNDNIEKAWTLLANSVFNGAGVKDGPQGIQIILSPRLDMKQTVWYDPNDVLMAWDNMIMAAQSKPFSMSKLFKYDLVDLTRQSLQVISIQKYTDLITAYKNKDQDALLNAIGALLDLLEDLDQVLATDEHFMLGKWLASAQALGVNPKEKQQYDLNARYQITTWGPNGEILDYANKQWSGLVMDYYKPRWQLFSSYLMDSVSKGVPYNATAFREEVFQKVELAFVQNGKTYPITETGDSYQISTTIHSKYRPKTLTRSSKLYFKKLPKLTRKGKKFVKFARKFQMQFENVGNSVDMVYL
ncbi:unnamed protein product [Owenia fusiformis]|uniref:Alpha-N-acetylglucosaminidase n=1 Tax=Owenia fusiformis TaxID=6347 RepID=A0A8S4MW57_OWEFU|nr:unnamed protein product [Owenia fusiformis]